MSKKAVLNEKKMINQVINEYVEATNEVISNFNKMFPHTNIKEELKKQGEAYVKFKRHFPDANDERFKVLDEDGEFNVIYERGDGSGREVWSVGDGKFLVDPNTFSDSLKKDLGRRILFPYTLLPTVEVYSLHPTPFNRSTKSIPTDLNIYVTPDKFFVANMKNVFTNETLTFTTAKQANKWLVWPQHHLLATTAKFRGVVCHLWVWYRFG